MRSYLVIISLLFIGNIGATDFQCWNLKSTNTLRSQYLTTVNNLRGGIAGGSGTSNSSKLPQGKNVYKLNWDCLLEEQAEKIVEQCDANAKAPNDLSMVITKVPISTCNPTPLLKQAVHNWWNVVQDQNLDPKTPINKTDAIASFATLAYGEATRIGCSQKNCDGELIMACMVYKKGPADGQPIYEVGAGCKTKEDCTTYAESKCNANTGMCIAGYIDPTVTTTTVTPPPATTPTASATTPDSTTTAASTAAPSTIPPDENKMCPENANIISDAVRRIFLNRHNSQRSVVARGAVIQGAVNQMARPCSKMNRLQYGCDAEKIAHESAKRCSESDDTPQENKIIFRQNLDPVSAAKQATNSWADEIKTGRFDQQGGRNAFLQELRIPHYAKMVWDTNTKLGCAVHNCGQNTHVVCRYEPGGGRYGYQVYKIGPACNRCTLACTTNVGLCG